MPKVSVIIPCYNQGRFIDESVDSVLGQTFQDFEIIIVNDGSDDDFTRSKLLDYSKPKTRVIETRNKGLSAARNRGFLEAKGEFIQFLDADDIILPSKFEEQISIFASFPDTGVSYSDYRILDDLYKKHLTLPPKTFLSGDPVYDFLFRWERGLSIPIHCGLFKKSLWTTRLPFNEELKAKEDWFMWCDLAVRNTKFFFLEKELAIYRFHENNMSKDIAGMTYASFLATYYILQIIPESMRKEFLQSSILNINELLQKNLYPELINRFTDLQGKFKTLDKTIDYKIGNLLLKPYRFIKSKITGKEYI